ncbi:tyrosine phosphatase Pyp2 [Schizosaccharomyces cryophilus OY26]|uniref:protein-tyrosine-phosphatase n=1 Tax=Schizosaccharomyces cryophilus (strain OY26 / ATCC MYA-4695 / CBS 11777 / NBRC 106824 / NRRL Y48691) TaxID=653667 RepID=S9WZQ6_SCHCR|nr:tyrosine phosphatase Pyp2 [Schizosaccharomyces cryophilus OY26]EPY50207.1 tyrosine phosphatase Pyp2 [Schizosaccharomyces cryophilus OY26]
MLRLLSNQEFYQVLQSVRSGSAEFMHIFDLRLRSNYIRGHIKDAINVSLPTALLRRPSFDIGKALACISNSIKVADFKDLTCLFIYDAAMAGLNRIYDFVRKFRSGGYTNDIYVLASGFEEFAKSCPEIIDYNYPSQFVDHCMYDAVIPSRSNTVEFLDPPPASTTVSPDYSFPLRVPIHIPSPLISPSVASSTFSERPSQSEYPGFEKFGSPVSLSPQSPHPQKSYTSQLLSSINTVNSAQNEFPFMPMSPPVSRLCSDPISPIENKLNPLSPSISHKSPASRPALRSLFSFPSSPRKRPPLLRSWSSSSSFSSLGSEQQSPVHNQLPRKNSTNANLERIINSAKIQPKGLSENNPRTGKKLLQKRPGGLRRMNKPSFGKDFDGIFSKSDNKQTTSPNPWGSFKQVTPPPAEMMADLQTASIFCKFKRLEELEQRRRILVNDAGSDWSCLASSRNFSVARKNRYTDIVPYDKTRVRLVIDDERSDYINASHISSGFGHYIACQAPQPDTLVDFWEMIWHYTGSDGVVVMLTDLYEAGNEKCAFYWPDSKQSPMQITSTSSVELLEKTTLDDFHIEYRVFCLRNQSQAKIIRHFRFRTWTDGGCPATKKQVVASIRHINEVPNSGPVFVHCSAGVGRTGTYIALDQLVRMPPSALTRAASLEDSQDVLFQLVDTLRRQRMKMVQTFSQFRFLYSMAEYLASLPLEDEKSHKVIPV